MALLPLSRCASSRPSLVLYLFAAHTIITAPRFLSLRHWALSISARYYFHASPRLPDIALPSLTVISISSPSSYCRHCQPAASMKLTLHHRHIARRELHMPYMHAQNFFSRCTAIEEQESHTAYNTENTCMKLPLFLSNLLIKFLIT